ncbi:hypothetical protein AMS58_10560 [Pseudoalteromonas porphyrae]|uniref:Uncharacterized protein n=2 Tax=Pseudoalteromonas TaxID=53246 RepID=A0A0N1ELB0_9GAMM|nr:hypothetical protein [Pseudoalteromonas porphyrae]KPH63444.1 hypothetical protein ADS77_09160 [Pseudoalteromonas porphyrae]KPH94688.1 hypothetical protein AMS58_10560 [Pseudoalteromonas porphyrae]
MKFVLSILIINHLCFLGFEYAITSMLNDQISSSSASSYAKLYVILVFPVQLLLELTFFIAMLYQAFIVFKWRANGTLWIGFIATFLMVIF